MNNYERRIDYDMVVKCYKLGGVHVSPLLEPVDKIQDRLRAFRVLTDDEQLIRFDPETEEFIIKVVSREPPGISTRARLWLVDKFLNIK